MNAEITVPTSGTQLVTSPDQENTYTRTRKKAVRGAITQGLAEYLMQLSFDAEEGGRKVRFVNVFSDRAVWESGKPKFPSALVKTEGQYSYDATNFTPQVVATLWEEGEKGAYLLQTSECIGQVSIELWATDPDERDLLVTMLEDQLSPVEWMSGFRLDLPHYFGARAAFLLTGTSYLDSPEDTIQRYVKAILTLEVRCPVLRLTSLGITVARGMLRNNTTDQG